MVQHSYLWWCSTPSYGGGALLPVVVEHSYLWWWSTPTCGGAALLPVVVQHSYLWWCSTPSYGGADSAGTGNLQDLDQTDLIPVGRGNHVEMYSDMVCRVIGRTGTAQEQLNVMQTCMQA